MKSSRNFLLLITLVLVCGLSALAQTAPSDAKEFNKDGLSFNYPAGWTLQDDSNQDVQQLSLARTANDPQIRVLVHRGHVSGDKMSQAKSAFIDPYVASTFKQFEQMGAKPERSSANLDIGDIKADGVIIRAMLDEPGAAQIFWALINQRVVVLTIFGPDKAIKAASGAWDTVRNSLKIKDSKPQPKPSPK
jgi:hypothetical protein